MRRMTLVDFLFRDLRDDKDQSKWKLNLLKSLFCTVSLYYFFGETPASFINVSCVFVENRLNAGKSFTVNWLRNIF